MDFNFSDIHEAIARAIPDREALVFRDRRLTHAQLAERSRRLANYLLSRGLRGMLKWFEAGEIRALSVTEYPFDQVAQAHRDLESGNTIGKLVLVA